jgi:mono/diheme cytochrome c family protein
MDGDWRFSARSTSLPSRIVCLIIALTPGLVPVPQCRGGEEARHTAVDYLREVKPLLRQRCYTCHGVLRRNSGLRVDTAAFLSRGGDSGPAIVAGKSKESLIVEAITGKEGWRMPPEGDGTALSEQEIAKVRAWIDQGARAPADEQPQPDPRKHWSFRPPVSPAVPRLSGSRGGWVRTPIDAFLAQRHEQLGLTPRAAAAPGELIRRLCLDLIGLLPAPEEVRAFVADPSDRAYEEVVDRLLASPQYGERWGRHWMDVWRYSDWDGFGAELRESQPHIWRWRDWIVESLNSDLGYDQMIVQMLAADEAAPDDSAALRATGFLARNWYKFNRNVWLDATIEHTAKAFLGLTINCARCHDHKYDPIGQSEYYRFRAFFEPHTTRIDRVPGQADSKKDGLVRVYDSDQQARTFLFVRGDEKRPAQERPLEPGIPQILAQQAPLRPSGPLPLPATAYYPALNTWVQEESLARARSEVKANAADLAKDEKTRRTPGESTAVDKSDSQRELAARKLEAAQAELTSIERRIAADRARYATPPACNAPELARAAAKAERVADVHRAELSLLQAELALADAEAAAQSGKPKDVQSARKTLTDAKTRRDTARADLKSRRQAMFQSSATYSPLGPVYPATSTGRRLALAHWITNRRNPLTARVAINHIWMRHFGVPLVPTEFDFGVNGKPPTHAALLDWLTVTLMDNGWKMKPIHRLIVTSGAYRMGSSSGGRADPNLAIDPQNREYWRMNVRRMEAEAVRDNLFQVAGNLDLTLGGPDLDPETGLISSRRSLYFRHAKEKRVAFLRLFDSANVLSCYRRSESVVPQQALALANSPLSFVQARRLAGVITAQVGGEPSSACDSAFVELAFERVVGRAPTADEQIECARFLGSQARRLADRARLSSPAREQKMANAPATDPVQRARENLVHVLLNHNDFVTIR